MGPFVVLDAFGREQMPCRGHARRTTHPRSARRSAGPGWPDWTWNRGWNTEATRSEPDVTTETIASFTGESVVFGNEEVTFADAFVVADGAVWLQTFADPGSPTVVSVDTTTLEIGRIPIDGAGPMLATGDAIWVGSFGLSGDGSVSRIDLESRTVSDRIDIPALTQRAVDLIVAAGGLWVTGSEAGFLRVDRPTLAVKTYPATGGQDQVWVGEVDGHLWSHDGSTGFLTRIDPATGDIRRFEVDPTYGPDGAILAGAAIWTATWDGAVTRFDTTSGEITTRLSLGTGVAWGSSLFVDDTVWFTNSQTDTITGLDATTAEVTAAINVDTGGVVMTAQGAVIWVGHNGGLVSRIDIDTREVTEVVKVAGRSVWPLFVDDDIWLVTLDGSISRITGAP